MLNKFGRWKFITISDLHMSFDYEEYMPLKIIIKSLSFASSEDFSINYFLIIRYNEVGAAIATTLTIVGENITRVIVAKQKTGVLTIPIGLWNKK